MMLAPSISGCALGHESGACLLDTARYFRVLRAFPRSMNPTRMSFPILETTGWGFSPGTFALAEISCATLNAVLRSATLLTCRPMISQR
jgi:hypothetical protein